MEVESVPHPPVYDRPPSYPGLEFAPDSRELFVVVGTSTHKASFEAPSRTTTEHYATPFIRCNLAPVDQYAILPGSIAALCSVFGVFYCLFGYRYFKVTMFLTGFLFGSIVTYLICLEENLLPTEGKLGVAVGAGVLCGLITALVRYVGLFMTGYLFGFLLAVAGLVIAEPFVSPPPTTNKWIPIGAVLSTGVLCALVALYFQKSVTLLATALIGAGLIGVGCDYFIELHDALRLIIDRLKAEPTRIDITCWLTWIVLGLVPGVAMVGALVQWRVTSQGFDHNEVIHIRRRRKPGLQGGMESGIDLLAPESNGARAVKNQKLQSKDQRQKVNYLQKHRPASNYRHLYQIRRFNGDIIAQNYVCQIQDGHHERYH